MALERLADAFYEELQDMLSAEQQLTKTLPKVAEQASSADLRHALEDHFSETEHHVDRVERAFEDTGRPAKQKTCEAMKGLIRETERTLNEESDPSVRDAILISCAQKIEHYEIAGYGTLCTWAEVLGYEHALQALKQNIDEEERADAKLTELAGAINQEAVSSG